MTSVSVQQIFNLKYTWPLLDDCLTTAWWLPDDCLMTTWWSLEDRLKKQKQAKSKLKAKLFTKIWNWTVWWIFSYCSVHPSSVLELLRTLLSFSKSNVYFRPGFFFPWAVKHEHMFVGKKERGKKAKKKYVQVPGFGQKMYYFTFNGILSKRGIVFCCYNCLDLPWEKFFQVWVTFFPTSWEQEYCVEKRLCKFEAVGREFGTFSRHYSCLKELGKQVTNNWKKLWARYKSRQL